MYRYWRAGNFFKKKPKRTHVLDEDIKSILKPFYIFQTAFAVRKFIISKQCITTVSIKDVVMSFVANIANITLMVLVSYNIMTSGQPKTAIIFAVFMYIQLVLNFFVTSAVNIGYSRRNIELILKLQSINRLLRDPSDKESKVKRMIWGSTVIGFLIYCALFVLKYYLDPLWNVPRIVMYVISMTLDIEMMYANTVANFLAKKIRRWNKLVRDDVSLNQSDSEAEGIIDENIIRFKIFNELIDGNILMSQVLSFRIFFHVATIFIQIMVTMAVCILRSKQLVQTQLAVHIRLGHLIEISLVTGKALLLQTVLCSICEDINKGIKDAQTLLPADLSQQESSSTRRFAKNVRRVCATRFQPLRACGVFAVDAALPLRVGALIATYTVVVLQFAFL